MQVNWELGGKARNIGQKSCNKVSEDPNTRKDRGQEEKGVTEDEMVG